MSVLVRSNTSYFHMGKVWYSGSIIFEYSLSIRIGNLVSEQAVERSSKLRNIKYQLASLMKVYEQ